MKRKKVLVLVAAAIVALPLLGYVGLFLPLPPERTLKTESSADGSQTLTYSWRPAGLLGALGLDNCYVYLTVRGQASGRVLARHSSAADVPDEAEQRLKARRPW
jgi:hypothetical protein